MAYSPQTWVDGSGGGTPITAARLGVIESGLQAAAVVADTANAKVADLPEFSTSAQTATVGTPANMLSKITRYDTTGGAISQTLPAATAGAAFAVGWDAGTAALTFTAAGSDVIGSGSTTSFVVPLLGEVLTYHCTTAGRWRSTSGLKTQSSLDAAQQAALLKYNRKGIPPIRNARPAEMSALGTYVDADAGGGGTRPGWLSADGLRLFSYQNTVLRDSTDEGVTWRALHTFAAPHTVLGVREMANGELLVSTSLDLVTVTGGEIWISSGYASGAGGASATWSKRLTMDTGANAENWYSFSPPLQHLEDMPDGVNLGIVLVGEYGVKASPNTSRKVYLSEDFGSTWRIIYDPVVTTNHHHHGVAYDPWWDCVWISMGDGAVVNSKVCYSLDWRNTTPTWIEIPLTTEQAVAIWPMPSCILLGNDSPPNGIHRIERLSSTPGDVGKFETVFKLDTTASLTQLCRSIYQRPGGPLIFSYTATRNVVGSDKGYIVTTWDGTDFDKLWQEPIPYTDTVYASGEYGVYTTLGPLAGSGKLTGHMVRDSGGFVQHRFTLPKPTWVSAQSRLEQRFPLNVEISPYAVAVASTSWTGSTFFVGSYANGVTLQSSLQNASLEWDVLLGPGRWSLALICQAKVNTGNYHIYIDNVLVGVTDTYIASGTENRKTIFPNILIRRGGVKRVKIQIETKNAASSGYSTFFSGIYFTNTGPSV